jgi:DNA polymerase III delta prime subunit
MAKLMAKPSIAKPGSANNATFARTAWPSMTDPSRRDRNRRRQQHGVDEVRDLIDKVKYAPIKGKYKIYIIDEVHMMTSARSTLAENA